MLHDDLGALRVVELEPHDDTVLADADEPVRVELLDLAQAAPEPVGDVVHHRAHLGPPADLEHLERDHAAELGTAAGGDVAEPVLLEPRRALLGHDHARDRVHAAGDALADDHDVGLDAGLRDAPHLAGAHEPGLHLVGDVEGAMPLAQPFDALEVSRLGQREPVRRGDRLEEHRGHVAGAQRALHRLEVVERHLQELVGPIGQEQAREAVVPARHGEAGVAVVALQDRDDLAPLTGVAGGLDRDVGGLAAARAVHHPAHVRRARLHQRLGERGAGEGGEVMVADVEPLHRLLEGGDQLGVAVAEVVGAAVQMQVDQPPPCHVPEEVALRRSITRSTPASCQKSVLSGFQNSRERSRKSSLDS